MAESYVENLSGIVVNQNVPPAAPDDYIDLASTPNIYQEFYLPSNYARGTDSDTVIPPMTGFQFLANVRSGYQDATCLLLQLQYKKFGQAWTTLTQGWAIGAEASGDKVWMTFEFDSPIEITADMLPQMFRVFTFPNSYPYQQTHNVVVQYENGIAYIEDTLYPIKLVPGRRVVTTAANIQGVLYQDPESLAVYYSRMQDPIGIWYSTPNPLATSFTSARYGDGVTAVTDGGNAVSILFRVLALVGDSGTDFLGNPYRSAVVVNSVDNTSTVSGTVEDLTWMSKPNPSRFAVESLYYDLRKEAPVQYGTMNLVKNPSGEVNASFWFDNRDGVTPATVSTAYSTEGSQSLRVTGSSVGADFPGLAYGNSSANRIRVRGGKKHSVRLDYKITTLPGSPSSEQVLVRYYDSGGTWLSGQDTVVFTTASPALGTKSKSLAGFTAPSGAVYASILVFVAAVTGAIYDMSVDKVFFGEVSTLPSGGYLDGDYEGYEWTGGANVSESVQLIQNQMIDEPTVVDSILVDPVTPGVFFHVYYTNDVDDTTTPTSPEVWDNRLWTRVPATFQANRRETHVLPSPITAKFVKVEFSNLQAKSYNPGDFAKPVSYKKHPKWVLDYFAARLNARNALEAKLMHKTVGVVFDGYDLAYNYYLDDLSQEPDQPVEISGPDSGLDAFIKSGDTFMDEVDPLTASKIKVAFKPYAENIAGWFTQSLLGQVATQNTPTSGVGSAVPVETSIINSPDILQLRNTEVAFENDLPAMFFFVTCRHKYREVTASFTHNRAYFVGIRQISFARESYSVQHDSDQYLEPSGDLTNIERNDFVTVDGIMSAS